MKVDIATHGRLGILNYINSLNIKDISIELLLFFDAIRSVMYIDKSFDRKLLSKILNFYVMEKINVN